MLPIFHNFQLTENNLIDRELVSSTVLKKKLLFSSGPKNNIVVCMSLSEDDFVPFAQKYFEIMYEFHDKK